MDRLILGTAPRMKEIGAMVQRLRRSRLPVLIEGEPGSGKNAMAQFIHSVTNPDHDLHCIVCERGESPRTL